MEYGAGRLGTLASLSVAFLHVGDSFRIWLAACLWRPALPGSAAQKCRDAIKVCQWTSGNGLIFTFTSQLDDIYREAIVLCDLEGKTRKQVAGQLGIPESTFSGRLTTARRQLAQRLKRRGATLLDGAMATLSSQNAAPARVPGLLVVSTVKAANALAAGAATTGLISSRVGTLTKGVMKAMFITKMKTTSAIVIALVVAIAIAALGHALAAPVVRLKGVQEAKGELAKQPQKKQNKTGDVPAFKPLEINDELNDKDKPDPKTEAPHKKYRVTFFKDKNYKIELIGIDFHCEVRVLDRSGTKEMGDFSSRTTEQGKSNSYVLFTPEETAEHAVVVLASKAADFGKFTLKVREYKLKVEAKPRVVGNGIEIQGQIDENDETPLRELGKVLPRQLRLSRHFKHIIDTRMLKVAQNVLW